MASKSAHTRGHDIVQEIRNKVDGYDLTLDQWDNPPTAAELTAALALYPTEGSGKMQDLERKARPYLQTRAYVQSNVEHSVAMERLAMRINAANRTGQMLTLVVIVFMVVQILVAFFG